MKNTLMKEVWKSKENILCIIYLDDKIQIKFIFIPVNYLNIYHIHETIIYITNSYNCFQYIFIKGVI